MATLNTGKASQLSLSNSHSKGVLLYPMLQKVLQDQTTKYIFCSCGVSCADGREHETRQAAGNSDQQRAQRQHRSHKYNVLLLL